MTTGDRATAIGGESWRAGTGTPAGAGPRHGTRGSRVWPARAAWAAGIVAVTAILFFCYCRQSGTVMTGSDGGSIALQAWDMLHGNVLLRHWTVSDVSFYPTELVQYALIEKVWGLGPEVVHIAGAMTYTLLILLAAWLARGRATGREGLIRALVAVVVMLAPAPGAAPTLLMSPDHFGSTVPVLLTWLAVELLPPSRGGRVRWFGPAAVAILLAWGQFADGLILVTGVAPMVIVCGVRAGVKLWQRARGSGVPERRAPGTEALGGWPWAEVSLAAAALVSVGLARAAGAFIRLSGGFAVRAVPLSFAGRSVLPHNLKLTAEGLLALFGADFTGPHSRLDLAFAALHLIVVAAAAVAFVLALGRLGRDDELVVPGLAIAIVLNIAAYVPTSLVQDLRSTREISAVLPFAAVLAGRLLAGPLLRARLTAVLAVAGAVCAAALGYHAAQPPQPAQNQSLAAWLASRHLSGGLAVNYWAANSTTLDSGARITVRQVGLLGGPGHGILVRPLPRELKSDWYSPASQYANFYVTSDTNPASASEQAAAVRTFGPPAQTLHPAGYTVLVWHKNLLADIR